MLMKNGFSCHKLPTKLDMDISKQRRISYQINKARAFSRTQGKRLIYSKRVSYLPTYLPTVDMILQTNQNLKY